MQSQLKHISFKFATVLTVALLFTACKDNYKRVGEEVVERVFPQGVAKNITLTYTQTNKELSTIDSSDSRIVVVLRSPLNENYENLRFRHQIFPEGLELDFYDENGRKNIIKADYGMVYSQTNLIDLQGNVVIESHDGKKLETSQLYWDRKNKWIFTQEKFTYTNPEDGTVMDGEGMDFNRDFTYFNAHKTYGLMTIKEE